MQCRACPRLVAWRESVALDPPKRYRGQSYWAAPVPSFGDPDPSILVVGLAPAAHGANRTSRMFTGDRSGDWLFRSMFRAGLANQPTSVSADDGLTLLGARVTATVHCAPPDNRPTTEERDRCVRYLAAELDLLEHVRVIVALGSFGYQALWRELGARGVALPRPRPRFAHGLEVPLDGLTVLGSFHPSQQNTFTGRLTEAMLDAVFVRAAELAGR